MSKKWEWFRMYAEAAEDPKLEYLQDDEFRIWFKLLCLASRKENEEDRGTIKLSGKNPLLKLSIQVARANIEILNSTLEKLETVEVIKITEEEIKFINFRTRQYNKISDMPEESRKRKEKSRQKKKESQEVTPCHANVTPSHTESHDVPTHTNTNTNIDINTNINKVPCTEKSPEFLSQPTQENSKTPNSEKISSCSTSDINKKGVSKKSNRPKKQKNKAPYEAIVDSFNSKCISLPSVRDITPKRKKDMDKAWNFSEERQNLEFYDNLFDSCELSDWLTGRATGKKWCSFKWIFDLDNMQNILEGNYKNSKPNNGGVKDKVLENNKTEYERFLELNEIKKEEESIDLSCEKTIDTEFFKVMEEVE